MITEIEIGLLIRELRLKKGWNQIILAEKARVNKSYMGEIERAEKTISISHLMKITEALDIPLSNFFLILENRE